MNRQTKQHPSSVIAQLCDSAHVGDCATRERPISLLSRIAPSPIFYARLIKLYLRSARVAKSGKYDDNYLIGDSADITEMLEAIGVRLHIEGIDKVRSLSSPCVFLGNHMSTLETFILPSMISPTLPVTFVVKQSLIDFPIFGHIMRSRDPVVVQRQNPREDLKTVLTEGKKRLENGISIVVFPQTTRSLRFDPDMFNTIGVKLARTAGVPVVPFALRTDAWTAGRFLKDFGKIVTERPVHFAFGDAMSIVGNGREQNKAAIDFVSKHTEKWGVGALPSPTEGDSA